MIGNGIHEEMLRAPVEQHAGRECLVAKVDSGLTWGLSIRLSSSGARWVPVRSRRQTLRTWAGLTAVGRFADSVGLRGFSVEL
ncbi:hypothetical protein [Pseudomonas sp. H1h]|uniref:hypothetical protein n=1 Tax=Pseudomonas sp. H1h TaxID=1397280 RepID=UPI000469ED5F|nr:hypothetical protein [Pseudomonas sp. H1h]